MKRRELLEQNLTEEKNVKAVVDNVVAKDQKFLKREKRNLEDTIEDLEESLRVRLSADTAIDKSVVESTYIQLQQTKQLLESYKAFEQEFLN